MDEKIKINGRLEVVYKEETYKSNVQDIAGGILAISVPYRDNSYTIPEVSEKLEIFYYGEENSVYKFTSEVLGKKLAGIPLILVEAPEALEKVQRRNYYRINYFSDIYYSFSDEISGYSFKKGRLIDISGGGMKISISDKVNMGDEIYIKFQINHKEFILGCQVVRDYKDNGKMTSLGIEYKKIIESEREEIIRFIFKRMIGNKQR